MQLKCISKIQSNRLYLKTLATQNLGFQRRGQKEKYKDSLLLSAPSDLKLTIALQRTIQKQKK